MKITACPPDKKIVSGPLEASEFQGFINWKRPMSSPDLKAEKQNLLIKKTNTFNFLHPSLKISCRSH